ncbi:MAG: hypothetical protein WD557_15200 [Dehalococcoidia bacterium]
MTFSHTQPLVVTRPDGAEMDPLYDAWSMLREARRVPIDLGIDFWAREVAAMVHKVVAAISVHTDVMEAEDSPLMQRLRTDPEDARAVQDQVAEHHQLMSTTSEILASLEDPGLDNGQVLAVAERLIELEIALARHLNRLHEIFGRQPWHS